MGDKGKRDKGKKEKQKKASVPSSINSSRISPGTLFSRSGFTCFSFPDLRFCFCRILSQTSVFLTQALTKNYRKQVTLPWGFHRGGFYGTAFRNKILTKET